MKGWLCALIIILACAQPTSSRAYFKYVPPRVTNAPGNKVVKVKATGYFGPLRKDYASAAEYWKDVRINGKGKETKSGTRPKVGTIAADKRFYPFGTKIFIPEKNFYGTVEDIGSAIKGRHRIDIFCGHGKKAKKIALTWSMTPVTMIIIKGT